MIRAHVRKVVAPEEAEKVIERLLRHMAGEMIGRPAVQVSALPGAGTGDRFVVSIVADVTRRGSELWDVFPRKGFPA